MCTSLIGTAWPLWLVYDGTRRQVRTMLLCTAVCFNWSLVKVIWVATVLLIQTLSEAACTFYPNVQMQLAKCDLWSQGRLDMLGKWCRHQWSDRGIYNLVCSVRQQPRTGGGCMFRVTPNVNRIWRFLSLIYSNSYPHPHTHRNFPSPITACVHMYLSAPAGLDDFSLSFSPWLKNHMGS